MYLDFKCAVFLFLQKNNIWVLGIYHYNKYSTKHTSFTVQINSFFLFYF